MAVDNVARGMAAAAMSGGGGGGSSTLAGMTDVDISNPTNGQTLVYNATSEKWENGNGPVSTATIDPNTGAFSMTVREIREGLLSGVCTALGIEGDGVWRSIIRGVDLVTSPATGEPVYAVYMMTNAGDMVAIAADLDDYPVIAE